VPPGWRAGVPFATRVVRVDYRVERGTATPREVR